ncbi:hypothetical protein KUTeg_005524 [Tegillarca granosa]|uniref:Uncharacterized protein n=1 Tax=Tegillarca granosa TaxID=220873 RepID=A0ABQ9FMY8_TEGGR|nr:hypothetical protein KUTeg_005524 [Tegillarca granosa]
MCLTTLGEPVLPVERTPVRSVLPMTSFTRRATRQYIAKRRNGNYNTTPIEKGRKRIAIKHRTNVPIYHVRRKLQFGRSPPKFRGIPAMTSKGQTLHVSLPKSSQENQLTSSKVQNRQISREVNSLLQMSSGCVLPNRLRSSPRKESGYLHSDQQFSDYRLNSYSENLNLSRIE